MDVSAYFPDVVKLVICPSVELKHYVYLYLTHYCDYNLPRERASVCQHLPAGHGWKESRPPSPPLSHIAHSRAGAPCDDVYSRA